MAHRPERQADYPGITGEDAAKVRCADPELDPQLAAQALSAMVGRMAYFRYVQGLGNASVDSLARTLTRLWAGALGIPVARNGHAPRPKPSKPRR